MTDPKFSEGPVDDIPIEYLEVLNMPFCMHGEDDGVAGLDDYYKYVEKMPGCEPDPDHDPFKYRERLGPASPPQTLPQPLPQPLNRRNLRFGYKEDVFCPEGCKPKED